MNWRIHLYFYLIKPSKDKLTLELAIENLGAVDIELSRVAASAILEYFIFKRYEENDGEQLRPALKKEENVADADKDPYVCFRQREVKTERKMRRSDMLSMDKIRKLHEDLEKAKQLLDLVYEREVAQKDYIDVQQQLFGRRVQLRKLRSHFGIVSTDSLDRTPDLKPKKRSRQNDK